MNLVAVVVAVQLAISAVAAPTESAPWESALARGDLAADTGDDAGAIAAYREGLAQAAEADASLQVDILGRIAKVQRRQYDAGGGHETLRALEATLVDADTRCEAEPLEGDESCARARQELAGVRQQLAAAEASGEGMATPSAPTPAVPVGTPAPAPSPPTPITAAPGATDTGPDDLARRQRTANGLVTAGAALVGIGGGALVLLALPAWGLSAVARDRAESDPLLANEDSLRDRADRRRRFAIVSAIVGGSLVVIGVPFLGTGLGMRAKLEKEVTAGVAPLRGGAAAGVTVRF